MSSFSLSRWRSEPAISAVSLLGALAFIDSVFNYLWPGNGIHGTEGALLVVVSTFLLTVGAGMIVLGWLRGWIRGLFEILIALDLLGSALAAYLLEAWVLLALIVLAAIAWLIHIFRPSPRPVSTLG